MSASKFRIAAKWSLLRALCFVGITLTLLPGIASAVVINAIEVYKAIDRAQGTIPATGGYSMEACVFGVDIDPTRSTVTIPAPVNTVHNLVSAGGGEWCYEGALTDDRAALDLLYPDGNYIFNITGIDDSTDSKTVNFTASPPLAFTDITSPIFGGTVILSGDAFVEWTLEPISACSGATCGDGIFIGTENMIGDGTFDQAAITDTSFQLDTGQLNSGDLYELEVSVWKGTLGPDTTDKSQDILLVAIWEDINTSLFMTDGQLDIREVDISKGFDRIAGTAVSPDPYSFEACVSGDMIQSVTLEHPGPTNGETLSLIDDGEHCTESEFADLSALSTAYPDGDYIFHVTGTDTHVRVTNALVSGNAAPLGWTPITTPADAASVPGDEDLTVTWTLAENSSCLASPNSEDCGDGVFISAWNDAPNVPEYFELFGMETTQAVIPAATVYHHQPLEIEVGTFVGGIGKDVANEVGDLTMPVDAYEFVNAFIDVNTITVPEPTSFVAQLTALGAIMILRRREA